MSNIYIQEPATDGKVLLHTSVGDIDIELWSREAPKACRNFIQLCLEGYYDNTIFHRLVKGFIVQGGDPTGDGMGGESIYGEPFKDELHSRLRFVRRGLVAMANSGKDDNASQFFFTLNSTPELQNKHTIFGKVTGNTIYNMIKLEDSDVDMNERPLFPHKIISCEILSNPFDDIIPRETSKNKKVIKKEEKIKVKGSKNFSLLSFGDEAEEEEQEVVIASKEFQGKSKSSHDLLKNDPKLSSVPAVDKSELNNADNDYENDVDLMDLKRKSLDSIRNKFSVSSDANKSETVLNDDEEINENIEAKCPIMDKLCKVKDEFKRLKKQLLCELKKRCEKPEVKKVHENPHVAEFFEESEKYKTNCSQLPKRGVSREELALSLLAKFKNRLLSTRERQISVTEDSPVAEKDDSWLAHELKCQKDEDKPTLAKDANMRDGSDWFDIYDPRNPINKRRREPIAAECSFKKKRTN